MNWSAQNIKSLLLSLIVIGAFACTNGKLSLLTGGGGTTGSGGNPANNFVIANVTITAPTSSTSTIFSTKIFFDSTASNFPINAECTAPGAPQNNKPCLCRFSWDEINTTSSTAVPIARRVDTPVLSVQSYQVTCDAPSVYQNEVLNGAKVEISVVPQVSNPNLTMEPFDFIKGTTGGDPDFSSETGVAFNNIHRYVCAEKNQKGMTVTSRTQQFSPSSVSAPPVEVPLATDFCVSKPGQTSVQGCKTGKVDFSAQSYYRNLYVTSPNRGAATLENQKYVCPLVKESLTSGQTIGGQGSFWPMDRTFALAQEQTVTFSQGIRMPSVAGISGDPSTAPTLCTTGNAGQPNDTSISYRCMGFAAKPNSDGTCGTFKDSNGKIRQLYRLRRLVAIDPTIFEASGKVMVQPASVDEVYVLDMPVKNPNNPLKSYTMKGPSPCPVFAFLDHSRALDLASSGVLVSYKSFIPGTANGRPGYVGTNDTTASHTWDGINYDDIHFPDTDDSTENSCSAALPVIEYTLTGSPIRVTVGTTHSSHQAGTNTVDLGGGKFLNMSKTYVRPAENWFRHYTEDTEFEACAPLADPFQFPPLHFKKRSNGNVAWCAEAYPTQNSEVQKIDQRINLPASTETVGYFIPFTSHGVKNSSSPLCSYTPVPNLPTNYTVIDPAGDCNGALPIDIYTLTNSNVARGLASHLDNLIIDTTSGPTNICSTRTCDRTILYPSPGGWRTLPLGGNARDTENALDADPNYECLITYDEGNGKAGLLTPLDGCANENVTGVQTGGVGGQFDASHLEPGTAWIAPDY